AAEQARQERALLRLTLLPIAPGGEPLARGAGPHRGRDEHRGREHGARGRRREEAGFDERLAVDHLEVEGEEVVDLEALRALRQPLALEELFRLDALLRHPDAHLIAHGYLETLGAVEPL